MKTKITKREFDGRIYANIVIGVLRGIPEEEREEYSSNFVSIMKDYTFVGREETDPNPHPASGDRYLENVPSIETPEGLAAIIIELSNSHYNAKKSNRTKGHMLNVLTEAKIF